MAAKIVSNQGILGGKPIISGTRISVKLIMDLLGGGWKIEEILIEYPTLTRDAVLAAIKYAAARVSGEKVLPITRRGNNLVFGLPG